MVEPKGLRDTVTRHGAEIAALRERTGAIEVELREIRESHHQILETLGGAATKNDVAALQGHIDAQVNGLLREALNAVPAHATVRISKWHAIVAGCAMLIALAAFVASVVR